MVSTENTTPRPKVEAKANDVMRRCIGGVLPGYSG